MPVDTPETLSSDRITLRGATSHTQKIHRIGDEILLVLAKGKEALEDPSQLFYFSGMILSIDYQYHKFQDQWDDAYEYCIAHEIPFPDTEFTTYFKSVQNAYYEAKAIDLQLTEKNKVSLHPDRPSSRDPSHPTLFSSTSNFQTNSLSASLALRSLFPESKIKPFDGKPTEWQNFKSTFQSLVSNEPSLSNCEKFHFLRKLLQGAAYEVIENITVSNETFDQAWEALVKIYDNPRRLASFHLEKLLTYKPPSGKPTYTSLKEYKSNVTEVIKSLKSIPIPASTSLIDYVLCEMALRLMDTETRKAFELSQSSNSFPTFDAVSDFVDHRVNVFSVLHNSAIKGATTEAAKTKPTPSSHRFPSKSKPHYLSLNSNYLPSSTDQPTSSSKKPLPPFSCGACSGPHTLATCNTFKTSTPLQRLNLLRNWKGCKNCLCPSHSTLACSSQWSCWQCGKRHHSLLHIPTPSDQKRATKPSQSSTASPQTSSPQKPQRSTTPQTSKDTSPETSNPSNFAGTNVSDTSYNVLLGTVLVKVKSRHGYFKTLRAVLDPGSQFTFITEECVKTLDLPTQHFTGAIQGVNHSVLTNIIGRAQLYLTSEDSSKLPLSSSAIVVPLITPPLPQLDLPSPIWKDYQRYRLSDPNFNQPAPIDLLIGVDLYPEIVTGSPIIVHEKGPRLIPTIFGFTVMGKLYHCEPSTPVVGQCFFATRDQNSADEQLQRQLKQFWELEDIQPLSTRPVDPCEDHFLRTHSRTSTGRYIVSLPFKTSSPDQQLGNTELSSKRRFFNLERKLTRNPELRKDYIAFIQDHLDNDRMKLINTPTKYHVPHHAVIKSSSLTTKLRVVFDFSAPSSTGKSLNDLLMSGPKLQNDISEILLNFRLFPIAFTCDIVKMFPNILLNPSDRPFQHTFWRDDPTKPLQKFELKSLSFGLTCAPFLALRVLHQLAQDEGQGDLSTAAHVIKSDVYVDDIVTGAYTSSDAAKLQNSLVELLRRGGFQLSKWASNSPDLLRHLSEVSDGPVLISTDTSDTVKLLGLQWNPRSDQFSYNVLPVKPVFTRRGILSTIASIYDPIGFLAPVVFRAKCWLQRLWKQAREDGNSAISWDHEVPKPMQVEWQSFLEDLPAITDISIPRYVTTSPIAPCMLVGFCDSSELGYAAVIYLRTMSSDPNVFLLRAKTRVSPLKVVTIPRLELCGAVLLAELMKSTYTFLHSKLNIVDFLLYSDSSTVLHWLTMPSDRLKTFVANRVARIQELTPNIKSWRYVPSKQNPADIASRGLPPSHLASCDIWWRGPEWLRTPLAEWPKEFFGSINQDLTIPEIKPINLSLSTVEDKSVFWKNWIQRFSNLNKLIRSTAYVLRFVSRARKTPVSSSLGVSVEEWQRALHLLVRVDQQRYYPASTYQTSHLLRSVSPFVDEEGLIRVGGRLKHADIPYDAKHQLLLNKESHLTLLIIRNLHIELYHAGPTLITHRLRARYWVPQSRSLIRKVVRDCTSCLRYRARPQNQRMADLPSVRVTPTKVFSHVGIDFAGPFDVRDSLRRKAQTSKTYLCLFVCMATKALHLELVSSLAVPFFLAALDRFVARRGCPSHIFTDCGTTFVGANKYLKDLFKWLLDPITQDALVAHGTPKDMSWHFNPPYAPHHGGLWEAGVKSVKTLLYRTMGNSTFTYEELSTTFCIIEGILNSRPLCPLAEDHDEIDALTPSHFLLGSSPVNLPFVPFQVVAENRLTRWELVKMRVQHFWNRWKKEYLHHLQQRHKWLKSSTDLSIGQIVLDTSGNSPPGCWPLGRIVKLHPGTDERTRVVTIKTSRGEFTRPVTRLVLLPSNNLNP